MRCYRFFKTCIFCGLVTILSSGCRTPSIVSPAGNMTINAGDSVSFSAEYYPDAIYKWTFGGGAQDAYGQSPTVRFDRTGVYDACLMVVFNDLDSGFASCKVTVNDPSPQSYTLTLNNHTATRSPVDAKALVWVVEKDGTVVMRRNAKNESKFTYFDNTTGTYRIWLERFHNGGYSPASNVLEYAVP